MTMTDEQKARLEQLRTAKTTTWVDADRESADLQELEQLEYENGIRELVAKLETDIGKRGVSFEIVESVAGPVAVKLGDAVCYTKFLEATEGSGVIHPSDIQDFVLPNLAHPTREKYIAMCSAYGGLPYAVWPMLSRLYRGERDKLAGK